MKDAVVAFYGIAVASSLFLLAAICASCAFFAFRERIKCLCKEISDRMSGMSALSKCAVMALLATCTYIGGSKSIMDKTGHDDSIGLVSAEASSGGDVTNQIPQSLISSFGHGTNTVAYSFSATNLTITAEQFASKVWWRNNNKEDWGRLSDASELPDGLSFGYITEYNAPTTTVHFVFGPTNSFGRTTFYVGDDLPPTVIEAEGGITLNYVTLTSKKAIVKYTVDASALVGPGTVVFESRVMGSNTWNEERTVTAVAGTHTEEFVGFFVRKRMYWRLRLLVEVSE